MRAARLVLAWTAAALVLLSAALFPGELGLEGLGFTGLALFPWLALAGLPGDAGGAERTGPRAESARWTGAALPLIAVGVKVDLCAAVPPARVAAAAALGALGVAALAHARTSALASRPRAAAYASGWLALFLGIPFLAEIRSTAGADPGWLDRAASASPLGWALELARSGGTAPGERALAPAALVLVLSALSALPAARAARREGPA